MLAARLGLRAAFRDASQSLPRQRIPLASRIGHQTRHQSRYQRFGDQKQGSSGQSWSNIGPIYRAQYIWRNYQKPILVVSGGGAVFYVYNQERVPITNRRRFNVITPEREKQFAADGVSSEKNRVGMTGLVLGNVQCPNPLSLIALLLTSATVSPISSQQSLVHLNTRGLRACAILSSRMAPRNSPH
jgi:hypothetical protein